MQHCYLFDFLAYDLADVSWVHSLTKLLQSILEAFLPQNLSAYIHEDSVLFVQKKQN